MNRKRIRELVYQKYGGHCAYCGKKIDIRETPQTTLMAVSWWVGIPLGEGFSILCIGLLS